MLMTLEFDSEVPIYLQIRKNIIEGIAKGLIKDGDRLPAVRELASEIEVNLHTVNKAYNLLKEEGYVSVDRRIGVLVNIKKAKDDERFRESYKEKINEMVAEGMAKGLKRDEMVSLLNTILDGYEGR